MTSGLFFRVLCTASTAGPLYVRVVPVLKPLWSQRGQLGDLAALSLFSAFLLPPMGSAFKLFVRGLPCGIRVTVSVLTLSMPEVYRTKGKEFLFLISLLKTATGSSPIPHSTSPLSKKSRDRLNRGCTFSIPKINQFGLFLYLHSGSSFQPSPCPFFHVLSNLFKRTISFLRY